MAGSLQHERPAVLQVRKKPDERQHLASRDQKFSQYKQVNDILSLSADVSLFVSDTPLPLATPYASLVLPSSLVF